MSEFEIRRRLGALGSERTPRRDLWPGISARIAATVPDTAVRPRRSALRPAFVAAAGIALAVTVGLVAVTLHRGVDVPMTAAPIAAPPIRQSASAAPADIPPDVDTLSRTVGNDPRLAGAAVVLDAAHAELEQALEQQPDAVFLVGLLNHTNEQRMKLARFAIKAG